MQRLVVGTLMLCASTAAGAVVGLTPALVWTALGLPALPVGVVAPFLLADALFMWRGIPAPLSVRKQVPAEWTRLFSIRTAAVLYGARLGVGPLTILRTWTWWGAAILSVSISPVAAVIAGSVFGSARIATVLAAAEVVEDDAPARMSRLRGIESRATLGVAVLAVAVLWLASGCSADGEGRRQNLPSSPTPVTTVAPDPQDETLASLLPTQLPGYEPAGPPDFAAGPLDLRAAAALEADADAEAALLSTRGFVRGFVRSWTGAGDRSAVLSVYEFADPAGAAAYVRDGEQTLRGRGATSFPVDEIAGASGFSQTDDSGTSPMVVHAVVFVREARVFLTVVSGTQATPDDARGIAATIVDSGHASSTSGP